VASTRMPYLFSNVVTKALSVVIVLSPSIGYLSPAEFERRHRVEAGGAQVAA
jgi:hypothetical protein